MNLYREETFGPVVAIYRFDDVKDAITAANDSEYGLNASIRTLTCAVAASWRGASAAAR